MTNATVVTILRMLTSERNALSIQRTVFMVVPQSHVAHSVMFIVQSPCKRGPSRHLLQHVASQKLIQCCFFGKLARFDRKRLSMDIMRNQLLKTRTLD
jgi:hypothetical protein